MAVLPSPLYAYWKILYGAMVLFSNVLCKSLLVSKPSGWLFALLKPVQTLHPRPIETTVLPIVDIKSRFQVLKGNTRRLFGFVKSVKMVFGSISDLSLTEICGHDNKACLRVEHGSLTGGRIIDATTTSEWVCKYEI